MNKELISGRRFKNLFSLQVDYQWKFNERLKDGEYVFGHQQQETLKEFEARVKSDVADFKKRSVHLANCFHGLKAYSPGQDPAIIDEIARKLTDSDDLICKLYDQLRPVWPGGEPIPRGCKLNRSWIVFRHVQVMFLMSLEYIRRYGSLPEVDAKELAQDISDANYLVSAAFADGFATNDKMLKRMYALMRPDGYLIYKNVLQ